MHLGNIFNLDPELIQDYIIKPGLDILKNILCKIFEVPSSACRSKPSII